MAPELLRDLKYGMQADIWSVGVVYYQLLYGRYPFLGKTDLEILNRIEKTRPDYRGVNLSPNAKDFIERCLTDNPQKRISWKEIYTHPLIREDEKLKYVLGSKLNVEKNQKFYNGKVEVETDLLKHQMLNKK